MSRQNKKKLIVNTEISEEPKTETIAAAEEPEPEYCYFGITGSKSYFHVSSDPDECVRVIKSYCNQNETFDIFQINNASLDCKRVISNGYPTMFGRKLIHG